jgi:hypothetical protein
MREKSQINAPASGESLFPASSHSEKVKVKSGKVKSGKAKRE